MSLSRLEDCFVPKDLLPDTNHLRDLHSRPHKSEMDPHMCWKCSRPTSFADSRELCSYCAAITTCPEECCGAMKMVIDGEQLQTEVFEMLDATPSIVGSESQLEVSPNWLQLARSCRCFHDLSPVGDFQSA